MTEERNILTQTRTFGAAPEPDDELYWDNDSKYTRNDYERMARMYEGTLMDLSEKRIVMGTVVAVDDREVVVNIGFKSEGIIPISEFKNRDLKPGEQVEVYLETIENKSGQMVLSRRTANSLRTWEKINNALDEDIIMEGIVKRRTKGGFVVDLEGIEAFLPGSQIDVKPIRDYDFYVGQRMEFKVVKINHAQHNVVISHKALIEKDLEAQKAEIINNLEKGQVLEGVVKNITNFGVFIDLGGVDGLLHITDISWGRISSPEEVLKLDQKINVVVLDFDDEKKRISLGLKQLLPHPWDNLPDNIQVSSQVRGKVVTIADYGIFIEIMPGVEGLIHVSEMSWSQHLKNPYDMFELGKEVNAIVLTLNKDERKMSLGIKQLSPDPWDGAAEKYATATKHTGVVRSITNYGLFVELEEGVDGLIHIGDLSWSRKINHPSEFIQKDEKLEVIVLEIDVDNRKLRLGHKQLTEDPWETLITVFPEGSVHECTITRMLDKNANTAGALAELEYGVEGFIPSRHLKTEEGKPDIKEGDAITCKVIEFNKDAKRIVLSHTQWWKDILQAERVEKGLEAPTPKPAKQPKAAQKQDSEDGFYVNQDANRGTLGDLSVLSEMRSKLEQETEATVAEAPVVEAAAPEAVVAEAPVVEAAAPEAPESEVTEVNQTAEASETEEEPS